MRSMKSVALTASLFLLPGCGLYVNGRTQPVFVWSEPPGAEVILDDSTSWTTPCLINLTRHGAELEVYKYGYAPEKVKFTPAADGLLIAGDVLLGFPIDLIVDAAYGAWNTLTPDTHHVKLRQLSEEEAKKLHEERLEARRKREEERKRLEEERKRMNTYSQGRSGRSPL